MKLLIINPNTSEAMTEDIRRTILMVKNKEIDIAVIHSDFGAESLESFYDYTLASFGMIRCLKKHVKDYDGILIACFGDPGLYAIEEISDCPVVGIAEASMGIANLLGAKFSILAASEKASPMMDYLVAGYGMQARSAGTVAINMSVLDVEQNKEEAIEKLVNAGRIAKKSRCGGAHTGVCRDDGNFGECGEETGNSCFRSGIHRIFRSGNAGY